MFKLRKSLKNKQLTVHIDSEKRNASCRRVSFDIKYLGLGKCIDRRKNTRRKEDMFDKEEYDRVCHDRLGPGWL